MTQQNLQSNLKYRRVLVKLSGAAVAGDKGFGFDPHALEHIAKEILSLHDQGVQVAIVIGGGNIFRGNISQSIGIERAEADNIGMMGTVINSLMLRGALKARSNTEVRVMTAIPMEAIAEPYIRLRAMHHLEKGYIVILAGGIGQPYVTTDYPAAQRALELQCEALMAAKHGVDGVYTADPKTHPQAERYETLNYEDVLLKNLRVMDQSALLLARDFEMPVHLFNFDAAGSMLAVCQGKHVGTLLTHDQASKIVKPVK